MEHRQLGCTGVSVSKFCLGAMMFGAWGNPDHDESIRIIHAALDAGINFIDTADVYARRASPRRSSARRSPAAGATTSSWPRSSTARWATTPTSRATRAAGSSARSRTRCGGWAPTGSTSTRSTAPIRDTDIEETLSALSDLVHQGKVRYIGSSTFPASQIVEAQWVARDRHLQRFVTEQPPYSILVRAIEADVLPTCRPPRHGRHLLQPAHRRLAVGPLAQGRRAAVLLPREPPPRPLRPLARRPTSASSTPSSDSRSSPTRPASR